MSWMQRKRRPVWDRFWEKVDVRGSGECWPWTAQLNVDGYGIFRLSREEGSVRAARWLYETIFGPMPEGWTLDHVAEWGCTSTACVNPAHLEAVPPGENQRRSSSPWAVNGRATHCPKGHEYAGENLMLRTDGRRRCRACEQDRSREYQRRKRAAA